MAASRSSTPSAPPPALIHLDRVNVTLGRNQVLRDITWQLHAGTSWAIAGANGAGKSTFLRLLRGDLWPDPDNGGERWYGFDGGQHSNPAQFKERIAFVSPEQQERYWRQEWNLIAGEVVESGFWQSDYVPHAERKEARRATLEWAEQLRLTHLLRRDVQTLSQGELRRILIARALVSKPAILLLDEATQGLDVPSREQLLELLERVASRGTTLVYTTHRAEERVSPQTRVLQLYEGRIAPPAGRSASAKSTRPTRRAAAPSPTPHPGAPLPRPHSTSEAATLITLRGVDVYLDRRRVLQGLEWSIREGEHWAVLGPNGAGKSTLLKTVIGDIHPALGGVVDRFEGEVITTLWDVRERVGYLSADYQSAYESDQPVRKVIASGFFASVGLLRRTTPSQNARVAELLEQFELDGLADRPLETLSYGQRRRTLLARAVVHRPKLLALDEPFDGLDAASREAWGRTLGTLASSGMHLLMVTHHEEDLPPCFSRVLWLEDGRIRRVETRGG